MDEVDRNAEFEEKIHAARIAAARAVKPAALANGNCLNCLKRIRKNLRWCDEDCRDDWEARLSRVR